MTSLFQVGTVIGFLQGVFDSTFSMEELTKKGNFGLGTVNAVDGELVILDGVCYRINAEGKAEILPAQMCTPFALVTPFVSNKTFTLKNINSFEKLENVLEKDHMATPNIFYAIRIDGNFTSIQFRSEKCQTKTYRPLAETLPTLQTFFNLKNSKGTLVGFYCPKYSQGLCIPQFHFHYLDDKKETGGHVFELEMEEGEVSIIPLRRFEMEAFKSDDFDKMDLDLGILSSVTKVEKKIS
ncbi:Alpha-acetolactate decarboxylase precursor (plasmid) [Legionella adelaidensis]|uniref:Alpha-acetolactate decarboxylase n=1 Tax=Legionella adelaidensis TaxID=45056 RepID=A0A0W0R2W6_9GAMM|nr:acetolactate decarboxylase [Legionella adelaidensis]KTC65412.1 Alpha-acetolactate decarboxylase precursor [Legionella adelaidensis]VEH84766.1 Alpha-acetolactate decarboxylase precursor [Legionella adelaidensis]